MKLPFLFTFSLFCLFIQFIQTLANERGKFIYSLFYSIALRTPTVTSEEEGNERKKSQPFNGAQKK
jgi:hypothetical protein